MDEDNKLNQNDQNDQNDQNEVFILANYIFNSISILFASLMLITIIVLRNKEVNFSNRISLRLIVHIIITEMFFSICQLLRIDGFQYSRSIIYISSWGYIFSSLLICFLVMAILINIQLILLYNYKNLIYLKKYYLIIPLSVAMFLSLLPLPFGGYEFDTEQNDFWYSSTTWEWTAYNGWITLSIFYCIFSIIVTSVSLYKSPQSEMLSTYISRITFYSLIPIIAYSPTILSDLVNDNNNFLNLTSLIFVSSQSIFTLTIFLFDPIIDEVISERRLNMKHKQHVLENIQKGVYVTNIYKIDLELPSNKDQNVKQQTNNDSKRKSNYRKTIYNYAKSRISGITSVISNKKKSMDVKKDIFNLGSDEDDILCLL